MTLAWIILLTTPLAQAECHLRPAGMVEFRSLTRGTCAPYCIVAVRNDGSTFTDPQTVRGCSKDKSLCVLRGSKLASQFTLHCADGAPPPCDPPSWVDFKITTMDRKTVLGVCQD